MSMRTIAAVALFLAAVAIAFAAVAIASAPWAYVLWCGVCALTGLVLAIRRPANPIGWLFLVLGASPGSFLANGPVDPSGGVLSILRLIVMVSGQLVPFDLLAVLLILFPTGRPPTRRWWIPIVAAAVFVPIGLLSGVDPVGNSVISIVLGSAAVPLADLLLPIAAGVAIGLFFVAVASLFRRRRSATVEERQQLKWVAYACAILATALLATTGAFFTPLHRLDPDARFPVEMFGGIPILIGLFSIPIAVGVAVLRYRLYEIDALISRTLVYGSLSAILVLAYVAGVAAFQFLLSPFTSGSPVAVAVSTLAVVALFQPLRRRIQSAVDRRFYRRRYDAERTLEAFSSRLRDEVDLEALKDELLGAVTEAIQPTHVSVWLRDATS